MIDTAKVPVSARDGEPGRGIGAVFRIPDPKL
jgi:hypothetical protein